MECRAANKNCERAHFATVHANADRGARGPRLNESGFGCGFDDHSRADQRAWSASVQVRGAAAAGGKV